ncbi:hypothetical protein SAMN05421863_100537 [Nitrosomonas communis]|uniref:Uncharacterized protein n=1 Tax=Nitrosomonas communis TaxID=44574 RepID=A0A1I4KVT9_9PROT|nr:hypothetical protein SAMN05421863_100537 [Nitrosomonas communis]
MDAEGDWVGRNGASQLNEGRCVQDQQEGSALTGIQHHGENHAVVLVWRLRLRDKHGFSWIATLLTPG